MELFDLGPSGSVVAPGEDVASVRVALGRIDLDSEEIGADLGVDLAGADLGVDWAGAVHNARVDRVDAADADVAAT